MKVISEADVVLALGTRLGPFGSLPQYGFDYWPKDAKIIQVDIAPRRLGLTKGQFQLFFTTVLKIFIIEYLLQKFIRCIAFYYRPIKSIKISTQLPIPNL